MSNPPNPAVTAVQVVDRLLPGGRLQWTMNRLLPVGDTAPLFVDTLSDGQRVDTSFVPTITLLYGTTVRSTANATRWTWLRDTSTGLSTLSVDLQGLSLAGADHVAVTFQSVIDNTLVGTAPLSRLVGQGDPLSSSAVFLGDGAVPSLAATALPAGTLAASVYAVDGVVVPAGTEAAVGDDVTYRLTLRLPLTAAQDVRIVAVPPGTAGTMVFDGVSRGALPAAGHAQWGPLTTYTATSPQLSLTGGIGFRFGDILPLYGAGSATIDVLFTTTLASPLASGAALQFHATETESNSFGTTSSSTASAALPLLPPHLVVQTGTLYASGDNSVFTGTGGPGYSHDTGQFGAVVSSAELAAEPFADTLAGVQAGDTVTFIVAVQNLADRAGAYGVLLRDTMPAGFRIPDGGADISVVDGAGNDLAATGNLFDPAGGLLLAAPLAGYDPQSGSNVALVTFTLLAATTIATPLAALHNTATIVSYAAASGGPNVSGTAPAVDGQATTLVTTASPTVAATQAGGGALLHNGDLTTFNVTVSLPEGETRNLQIDELLPRGAGSWLELVSAQLISVGANLTASLAAGASSMNGHFSFGDVLDTPDGQVTPADTITVQVVARAAGLGGGAVQLQTVLSAADPNSVAGRWSSTAASTVSVVPGNTPPTITGASTGQSATTTMEVRPFAGLALNDVDAGQTETLTIQLSDATLGGLTAFTAGQFNAVTGTYTASGSAANLQQVARNLVFIPDAHAAGHATFNITLDDGAGGMAHDSSTTLLVRPSAPAAAGIPHNATLPAATFLTAIPTGERTVYQGEVYQGPVSYLQSQFIYDGTDSIAIVAQTPNTFVKNVSGSAAIQLLSGQNVVDAGHGSNFLVSGTGSDTFFLDGRSSGVTWDTIVGFHAGDVATLWGFRPGTTNSVWVENEGAPGHTGLTMHADMAGTGQVTASLTFAGMTSADKSHWAVTTGSVQGNDYMAIFAL